MGYGFKHGGAMAFKSFISVQANASTNITLKLGSDIVETARTDSNGICTFTVKKKGIYTLVNEYGLSDTVSIPKSGQTANIDLVYVATPANLTVFGYKTGTTAVYWTDETIGTTCSGSVVRMSTSGYPKTVSEGESVFAIGGTKSKIDKTTSESGYGFTKAIGSGVTQYYSRFNYVYVNGKYYYSSSYKGGSYTYKNYGDTKAFSASGTWTVPEGVRSVNVFCVGGGGGGAGANSSTGTGSTSKGGGGGGGGYAKSGNNKAVTPGQQISYTVGGGGGGGQTGFETNEGGDGGTGGTTSFMDVSASGGGGGHFGYGANASYGGAGGNAGGTGGTYYNGDFYNPQAGGSNAVQYAGTYYAGGGGGGGRSKAAGGNRGGGAGAYGTGSQVTQSEAGTNGTGGGGGGGRCRYDTGNVYGYPSSGGSGAIVISY